MSTLKQELYAACQAYVEQRLATAREAIADAQEAAAGETKSSAGDKYETGRAMAQLAEERARAQLAEAHRLAGALEAIRTTPTPHRVQAGSVVRTPAATYYIAISLGKTTLAGEDFLVVSPASPIGQALMGAQPGEAVTFQGRSLAVEEVL